MVLTPEGNRGNFFGRQNRAARRTEWIETWSLAPLHLFGTHLTKMGTSVTSAGIRVTASCCNFVLRHSKNIRSGSAP